MNKSTFHYNWLNFQREELLLEARVKDIKKKYPKLTELGELSWFRANIEENLGPKGVSKYLMWCMREMYNIYENEIEGIDMESPRERSSLQDIQWIRTMQKLRDLVFDFHKNQQRLEEKNIYNYDAEQLGTALNSLGDSASEKAKKEKTEALEQSEIIYDEKDIFAIRPNTKNASCYFGRRTRWCISATKSRNYFEEYTRNGKAFVMVRIGLLEPDDPNHKLAIVYDKENLEEEIFDAEDISHEVSHLYDVLSDELGIPNREAADIYHDIIDNGRVSVQNNPPDPSASWDSDSKEIEARYDLKHAYHNYLIDGGYFFSGGILINFDLNEESQFENSEIDLPSPDAAYSEFISIGRGIERELRKNYKFENVYEVHVDIQDTLLVPKLSLRADFSPDEAIRREGQASPYAYERFLDELKEAEESIVAMKRIAAKYLMDEGYMAKSSFFKFIEDDLEDFTSTLTNIGFVGQEFDDPGEEEVYFFSEEPILTKVPKKFLPYIGVPAGGGQGFKYYSDEITKSLAGELISIDRVAKKEAEKQMDLPISDLPPKTLNDISIPESLRVHFFASPNPDSGFNPNREIIAAKIELIFDDDSVDENTVEIIKNILKMVDDNYESVKQSVVQSLSKAAEDLESRKQESIESLPEVHKKLVIIANKIIELDFPDKSNTHNAFMSTLGNSYAAVRNWMLSPPERKEAAGKYLENYFKILHQNIVGIYVDASTLDDKSNYEALLNQVASKEEIQKLAKEMDSVPPALSASPDDDVFEEVKNYFNKINEEFERKGKCVYKKTGKKKGCSDSVPKAKKYLKALYANSDDVNEDISSYFNDIEENLDAKDMKIKKRKYDIKDLMDPDFNPWESIDEL